VCSSDLADTAIKKPSNDDMEEKIREHIAECLHRIDNIRSFVESKGYTNNDEKCIRNIEVLKTIITALEGYLSSKKKSGNDGWISVEEGLPNKREFQEAYCRNHYAAEFIVMIEGATRPTTLYFKNNSWFDEERNYYKVIAWQPLPEPYKGE